MKTTIQQFEEILNKKKKHLSDKINSEFNNVCIETDRRYWCLIYFMGFNWNTLYKITLSDLLFWKIDFLESLIWKFDWSHYVKNPRDDRWCIVWDYNCNSSETDYHKMQLVLLSSDEERILYIINNIA